MQVFIAHGLIIRYIIAMLENRLSVRLMNIWEKLAELNPPPSFAQFNIAPVSDIWQQCATFKVEPNAGDGNHALTIDFVGDSLQKLLPDMRSGGRITTKSMNMQLKKYLSGLAEVVNDCKTLVNSGTLVGQNNKMVKYRVCLLPFTDKNAKVAYIVVGFSWIEC